ncbi:MAG: hypothetical protein A2044_00875 [Candidatus Firestonebacteria bacterium GWA2_43_8]|nr:MAG: hypothetical protein A2044_00875 [Candidatus Firestonebacteria bacterium GWA2_43_8]
MKDSIKRVQTLLDGEKPDRVPLFDLIRSDAIFEHFSGKKLTVENAKEIIYANFGKIVDSTRPMIKLPQKEVSTVRPDGRKSVQRRWTGWVEHVKYSSSEEYAKAKNELLNRDRNWSSEDEKNLNIYVDEHMEMQKALGDLYFFSTLHGGVGLLGVYGEVGIEEFSYYLADCPEVIKNLLELSTVKTVQMIEHLPSRFNAGGIFFADDMAFNTGTIVSPDFLNSEYFPRLKRITDAAHKKNLKVFFHSDGNLMGVISGLAGAGIDVLNPIEVIAGMDIAKVHKAFPKLILAGGIDVSQLLPFGKPEEIKDAVIKAIEDAEGKIMIGSTTEMHEEVPIANFLALQETVLKYKL